MSYSSRSWEFPSCFRMFLFCGRHRQHGFKAVCFPCATTLLLGYIWKSLWIVAILPDHTVHCCHQTLDVLTVLIWPCGMKNCLKSFRRERNAVTFTVSSRRFKFEVLTTTVLLYNLKILGLWWGQEVFSAGSYVDQQRLCSGKIPDLLT